MGVEEPSFPTPSGSDSRSPEVSETWRGQSLSPTTFSPG